MEKLDVDSVSGSLPDLVSGISQDSNRIKPGYIFAARAGAKVHGLEFADIAEKAGAVLILMDINDHVLPALPTISVGNFKQALAIASNLIYNDPSKRLKLIGLSGTDGKTSSVHYIKSMLNSAGYECGMLGTIGYDTISNWYEAALTTPDIDLTCELLDEMTRSTSSSETIWAVMEVSSHALELNRVEGLTFAAVGITNLNPEHLDFHQTIEDYAAAKSRLFAMLPKGNLGVVNLSAHEADRMINACTGRLVSYGKDDTTADYKLVTLDHTLKGGSYRIEGKSGSFEAVTELIGEYQGENITLAAAILLELGVDVDAIVSGAKALRCVPGRMDAVDCGQPFSVLVDFAHTTQALSKALRTIRPLCKSELTVVFGCGGDRDTLKRPGMGKVAAEIADRVIITNDNPRTEEPMQIIADILSGVEAEFRHKITVEPDRKEAVNQAINSSFMHDVVVIAGKGAESYQIIGDTRHPFDDRSAAEKALMQAGWS